MRLLVITGVLLAAVAWIVASRLLGEAQADPPPVELRAQQIQSIAIDGSRGLPLAALRARLRSQVGAMIDATTLADDRAALEAELEQLGYLSARVDPASVSFGGRGGAFIVFDVDTGPMYHLRRIAVSGPGRRDAGVVTLAPGDTAVHDRIERARQTLAETFARRGTRIAVDVVLHRDAAAAALDVELVTR